MMVGRRTLGEKSPAGESRKIQVRLSAPDIQRLELAALRKAETISTFARNAIAKASKTELNRGK